MYTNFWGNHVKVLPKMLYSSADNAWKVCIVNWKGLDPNIIIMFTVKALRSKRLPHLAAYGCDKYVYVLISRLCTLWEASDVSLTALSTLWECEGNSGRSSLVSFSNASCSSWSDATFRKANQLWPVGSFSVNGCDLLQSLLGWLLTSEWKNFLESSFFRLPGHQTST